MKNIKCNVCAKVTALNDVEPGNRYYCTSCNSLLIDYPPDCEIAPHAICSYCGTEIEDSEVSIVCPSCTAEYHEDCWKTGDGCQTYGCSQTGALEGHIIRISPTDLESPPSRRSGQNVGPLMPPAPNGTGQGTNIPYPTNRESRGAGCAVVLLFAIGTYIGIVGLHQLFIYIY